MRLWGETKEGTFLKRLRRFSASVEVDKNSEVAYLPNTGRIWELLSPGQKVFLTRRNTPGRKTAWDLYLFPLAKTLVWADSRIANVLFFEAFCQRLLPRFCHFSAIRKEIPFRGCRFDFQLANEKENYLLEVKSVTLVKDGIALFPDAPTERGRRQLEVLLEARKEGYHGGIIFIVQREDARAFAPNREIDVRFSSAFERAIEVGIEAYAYATKVKVDEINMAKELTVST